MSTDEPQIIPGAEPLSIDGSRHGALVLHGFTGNPGSVRILADAFAGAGWSVEMPRLPGHGTIVEDMLETRFSDWSGEAEAAYQRLAARCDKVVIVGLSMGGSLALWLGINHNDDLAGIVTMNPAVVIDPAMEAMVTDMLGVGETIAPGIGSDIAMPDVVETAYDGTPLAPLRSLMDASIGIQPELAKITAPLLILTSRNDHVVPPTDSDVLAEAVRGPVEREWFDRSYHVITMDYDAEEVTRRSLEFAEKVVAQ